MRTAKFQTGWCVAAIVMVSLPLVAEDQPTKWWLEAGPVFRGGLSVKVNGGSYVQNLGIHAVPAPLSEPASVGPKGAYADRTYQDGYVKLDAGTLNPDSIGGVGNTWNWAYNQAGQYTAGNQMLSFHQTGDPGYTTMINSSGSMQDDMLGAGIQINTGFNFYKSDRWTVDLVFGFQGVWGAHSDMGSTGYQERISKLHVTDAYAVGDAVDPTLGFPPPAPGYKGTYEGPGDPSTSSGWDGGWPTITNTPTSRVTTREDLGTAYNSVNYQIQTDFYELTMAPRFRYAASEALSLHLTPKLGISYIDTTAKRSEVFYGSAVGGGTTVLRSWTDNASSGEVRFAIGVTAGADLELGRGFYTGIFGGYEWAVQSVSFAVGPNEVSVNGSGYVAGAVIGKRF